MSTIWRYKVDVAREAPGVRGLDDLAAALLEQAPVVADARQGRELHEPQIALRLLVGEARRSFHPVGEGDAAAGPHEAGGLGDELRLVLDVAPRVLAPHEVGPARGQAGRAGVPELERDAVVEPLLLAEAPPALDDRAGGVDARHRGDAAFRPRGLSESSHP
jgi:hypothetical protein